MTYPVLPTLLPGDAVGIVACSNALNLQQVIEAKQLLAVLESMPLRPVCGASLLSAPDAPERSPRRRAEQLLQLYADPEVKAIFDLSGGDLANEILPFLDYELIRCNPKPFWGYSDLTTVLNALLQKSGCRSVLYQLRNLVKENGEAQRRLFGSAAFDGKNDLWDVNWKFLQGRRMQGKLIGGNLRCLLKLAGTSYFPDCDGNLLFLESLGGGPELVTTHLCQLKQMGVFSRISGLLLGTFTTLERQIGTDAASSMIGSVVGCRELPIAKTQQIGHAPNSKALLIGSEYGIGEE